MSNPIKSHDLLLQIGMLVHSTKSKGQDNLDQVKPDFNSEKIRVLTRSFADLKEHQHLNLAHDDILIIALAWHEYIVERKLQFDPLELLSTIYSDRKMCLDQLERITNLLRRNIFYTEKKQIVEKGHGYRPGQTKPTIKYFKYTLLEYDICFHRFFIRQLLDEYEDITLKNNEPYRSNKEFLSDWFAYVDQLSEFSVWDFSDRKFLAELGESQANDLIKALEWKERIHLRSKNTTKEFPLLDLVDEYRLDENETTILVYLIMEDMEGNQVDMDQVIRLVSRDQHEMYRNRDYLSSSSKLVRNGLVEVADKAFFLMKGNDIRVPPDITRRIIMKTPVNEEEKLNQILKGEDLYTLLVPQQSFNDLILPRELKKTIRVAIKQYQNKVENTLHNWGLYDSHMEVVGKPKKKIEPGMLMLFYGPPGTGKTFAAGAIANALGKKLLITDISRIQSKWVGDSEKNVRRMFSLFERVVRRTDNPPVLLLNEADQFLSQRLRHMERSVDVMFNTMQNLFLEAFERLRGILIATTNLRDNLDTAFSRRFHLKIEFPFPAENERNALWKLHLPETIPGSSDIDVRSLARSYSLTGGQISIIVKNAATEAASRKGKAKRLTQEDLVKYCLIEEANRFDRRIEAIGFKV